MLSKIFKKNEVPPPVSASKPIAEPSAAQIAAQAAEKTAWEDKLAAAIGDDEALLAVAKECPAIDIKHAAVEALVSEVALKRAEREFREHDRRVHRTAKQRYETLVNRRLAAVSAAKLIETGSVLLHDASIPANRLVELDRAWQALDHALLEENQYAEYLAIWTRLSMLTRERGELQLQAKRWLADAEPALAYLAITCAEIVDGIKPRTALAEACAKVEAVLTAAPAAQPNAQGKQIDGKLTESREALLLAAAIDARLLLLEELQQPALPVPVEVRAMDQNATANASLPPKAPSPTSRWRALPNVADSQISALLDARFADWQATRSNERQARSAEAKQHAKEESKAVKTARTEALTALIAELVAKAETALAEGHVAESTRYLTGIDDARNNAKGVLVGKELHTRIDALQAETARLKGWQHWGGGRVRDDLVVEAEALAAASTAAKIAVKQHADAIENLRNRWKELDKLGGATNRTLWLRFDAALKLAHAPVAAHLAKLKAVREENLAARNKLLDNLDAIAVADPATAEAPSAPPDLRALARALEHFQVEWRKCGPVEHTVPHKAQTALAARMKSSVARLDAPLSEARRVAQLERDKLVARAKALGADTRNRDVITKVRELQTEWQAHAKTLPLMRQVENALWTEFKAATDAVFTQRDALYAARDNELKANQASREALIARLAVLGADTLAAEIKRTVADVDSEWRKCGDAPRAEAAKLDAQFRLARDAAQQHLSGSAKRGWNNVCDALVAKLGLCAEAQSADSHAELIERWNLIPALPAAWEKALHGRFTEARNASVEQADSEEALEELATPLLQLESALDIESLPAFQAARRDLKLRAMKAAIEGRQSAAVTNADIERWFAEVIAQSNVDAGTRARVSTVIEALRNKPLR